MPFLTRELPPGGRHIDRTMPATAPLAPATARVRQLLPVGLLVAASSAGVALKHRFQHPVRKECSRFFVFKMNIPPQLFHYRNFMCFNEFNPCSIRIFNIAEPSAGFSHVKGFS